MITRSVHTTEVDLISAAIVLRLNDLNHYLAFEYKAPYPTIKSYSEVSDMVKPIQVDFPDYDFHISWISRGSAHDVFKVYLTTTAL